jgi:hypothetical protein
MLSSGMKHYHLELMLSSGTTCYHLRLHVIIWDAMLSSVANFIIWDKMLSSGANVIMVSSGANVIIWCYHVMLSSGMITHPFFIFPENFTHSMESRFLPSSWYRPFWFFKRCLDWTQRAAVASSRATNLASHFPTCHPSSYLATGLPV